MLSEFLILFIHSSQHHLWLNTHMVTYERMSCLPYRELCERKSEVPSDYLSISKASSGDVSSQHIILNEWKNPYSINKNIHSGYIDRINWDDEYVNPFDKLQSFTIMPVTIISVDKNVLLHQWSSVFIDFVWPWLSSMEVEWFCS
jgi:hypothetical protein